MNPKRSVVVALMLIAAARDCQIGGEIRRHRAAMRGDARRLREHRDVRIDQVQSRRLACARATTRRNTRLSAPR